MHYFRSYQFLFDSPQWVANLLFGLLCQFIPVVGPLVLLGYQYEIIEELHLSRGQRYPDFTFNRFVPYLVRGLWPFIVQLCVMMPLVIVFMMCWFGGIGLMAAVADKNNADAVIPIVMLGMFALFFVLMIALTFLLVPLALWAGLAQEFKPGRMWAFMKEFLGLVLMEMVLAELFYFVSAIVISMVGLLLCFIGVYPAGVLITYARSHLAYQLYELYLERGGSEIPLKIEEGTRPS
jgi:hypothetical protein